MIKKNKICFATNNQHKLSEVANLLSGSFDLVGLADVGCEGGLAEDFFTLEENSRQKAEYVFRKFQISCFADDSGLEVEVLNGAPGVHSAYFAGPQRNSADNMALLLKKLGSETNRQAQFRTVVTLIEQSGPLKQFEGVVRGQITFQPRGAEGFGYDPIFLPDGFDKTMAEMTMEEKNKISHRARAVKGLVEYLQTKQE